MRKNCIVSLILCLCALCCPAKDNGQFDPFTASIEENISTPAVSAKQHQKLADAMAQLERTLHNAGYKASRVRSGEVVLVTIPCAELFAPNDTELKKTASKKLHPLVPYVKRTDNYKIVVAVHADNTGDAEYADNITAERATAIDAFFLKNNSDVETGIIPYGLGFDEPLNSNVGVAARSANRRVEIYFIPTAELIAKAQKR